MTFYTQNPSEYPDSWDEDGEGAEYCPECGCDYPREGDSHAELCETGRYLLAEEALAFIADFPDPPDTMAEQTGLDR